MAHKTHWLRDPARWRHGRIGPGNGTRIKRKITCRHCRWQAGLEPDLYESRKTAAPSMEPLGVCARRQVLAMVWGLA